MKKVLICGETAMPAASAQSGRLVNIAEIFKDLGYKCILLGTGSLDRDAEKGMIDEIPFQNINADMSKGILVRKKERAQMLRRFLHTYGQADVVVIAAGYADEFYKIIRDYSTGCHAMLIASVCEWYNSAQHRGLRGFLYLFQHRISTIFINAKVGNIISISRYLENYYLGKGCICLRLPTVLDVDMFPFLPATDNRKITIVYAGNPNGKDDIISVIQGIAMLNKQERDRVEFHIYGVDRNFLLKSLHLEEGLLDELQDSVYAHGRIPFEQVQRKISEADYTVLLRPNERYANAGFPTKVGESMAAGVPVIGNITSDLAECILDGKTGFVVEEDTAQSFAQTLSRVLRVSKEDATTIRANARALAYTFFDGKQYRKKMEDFLNSIISSRR